MITMGCLMLFLCVLAVLSFPPNAGLSYAYGWNNGQPQKCSKLLTRKEWRTLTHSEKAEWVGAVKCLASVRHERLSLTKDQTVLEGNRSLYDDFSYAHASVEHSVHRNAYFLPWHRWFTYLFDTSLRQTCGYSGPTPYWDWSRDHADLFGSPVFEDSVEYGLGGTGDCDSSFEADCTVITGAFASSAGDFELAWPIPHPLRRNLTLVTGWYPNERPQNITLGPEFVRNLTEQTTGDFFGFQRVMAQMHDHVHNFVGGDLAGDCPKPLLDKDCQGMADSFTPNDPLFWLHHAQLDRLWSEWQHYHPINFAAFSGMPLTPHNMTDLRYDLDAHADHQMPFDVQSVPVAPRKVFDTEAWPLCYRYTD
ncbi:tyrosinase family protein [Aspergillus candidus]|uniref:Monooxygenase-like protein n=1 Tax=Aspergillus candidus TaxID=41067 RepID=A0A2I2F3S2_ASPCN|nr:monooxygenase-like protein [Aspergillus candidus]PLB35279.1 monooxygenase-like protein [Aspergillus candidus]